MTLPVTTVEVALPDGSGVLAVLDALQRAGAALLELHDDVTPVVVFAGFEDVVTAAHIQQALHPLAVLRMEVRPARLLDWQSTWEGHVKPVQCGPLWIVPPGRHAPAGAMEVRLRALDAFGSGVHPTTRLVLQRLVELQENGLLPEEILDVGVGSGVLALAALRLGSRRAVGVDLDPAALDAAQENAKANGLTRRLRLLPRIPDERFGLILANILASTLTELAPRLAQALLPRGTLLISGVRTTQKTDVRTAFRRAGFRPAAATDEGDWTMLEFLSGW